MTSLITVYLIIGFIFALILTGSFLAEEKKYSFIFYIILLISLTALYPCFIILGIGFNHEKEKQKKAKIA